MAGYLDTRQMIIDTLMGRPEGTQIQPEDHQAYALNLLNYVRSVELSSGSTLTGIAETDTVPIEPYDSRVAYIASVPQNTVRTFTYFKKENNEPITITTTNSSVFVILLWNTQYWEYQPLPVTVFENDSFVGYFECASLSTDINKTISSEINQLTTDMRILVKMNNVNTQDNATLQIGLTNAKPLYYNGLRASSTNSWAQGEVVDIYYNGTNFISCTHGGAQFSTGEKVGNVGIDDEPTAGSENLVKSGGVQNELALGAVYDVSAKNPTAGPNNDGKFESLSALLSDVNLSALIPIAVRKGGMSIKFIQSSDNKYIQARLMSDEFTTNTTQWAIAEEGIYVDNSEFVYVKTDKDDRILWAIKTDGSIFYGAGVPQQVVDYIDEKIADLQLDEYEDIVAFLNGLEEGDKTLQTLLNEKVDKEEGKSLIDEEYAEGVHYIDNPEFLKVYTDKDNRVLLAIRTNGDIYYGAGVPQQVIDYIDEKIADFQLDEYEDIVAFLSDYLGSDTTLKAIIDGINAKVDEGLYMLGDLNSEFNPPFPMSVVGNKGDANCKYTIAIPLKDNFNIRFKVRLTENLFITTGSTTKSVFNINGNNVNVTYVRYAQKITTYEYQGVSKTSYYPTLIGGLSFLDSGTSVREDTNHNRGTFAFSIKYIGNGSDVKISNNGTQLSIDVDGTITTFAFSTYTTVYALYSALKNLSDFEVDYNDIEGHNSTELAKFVDVKLISTYYSNITGNPTGTKEEYTDSAPLFIPYAMDNKWHQVEIIRSGGLLYLTVDGLVKTPITIDMPDVSTLIFGGNVGALYKDLEIDTSTCRDAEIIEGVTGGRRITSSINPYIIIYEGHGMQNVPNADVDISDMYCSPERIQAVVDRFNEKQYTPVKIDDIVGYFNKRNSLPKKCYTFTFDDYRFENILNLKFRSVFTRNNLGVCLFIISNTTTEIEHGGTLVSKETAVNICKSIGVTIASHTDSHKAMASFKPSDYIEELEKNIYSGDNSFINSMILCFPFGETNQYLIDCMEWLGLEAGINVAYNSPLYAGTSKYNIPRREIGIRESWEDIIKEIK